MLRRTLPWILPFALCAALGATELIDADSALMRGDYSDAVQILQELANSGDATAQVRLARLYHRGEGVKQDIDKAVSLYLAAAELGHAEAQFKLGNLYLIGEELPQDLDWAQTFYRLAAEQGHVMADQNLREIKRVTEMDTALSETAEEPAVASDAAMTEPVVSAPTSEVPQVDSTGAAPAAATEPVVAATPIAEAELIEVPDPVETESEPPTVSTDGELEDFVATEVEVATIEGEVSDSEPGISESIEPTVATVAEVETEQTEVEQQAEIDHTVMADPPTSRSSLEDNTTDATPIEILGPIEEPVEMLDSSVATAAPTPPAHANDSALAATPTNARAPDDDSTDDLVSHTPSADEAGALRLAEEHGIDVQAAENVVSQLAHPTPAESSADNIEAAVEADTFVERFANAQHAIASENFADGSDSLKQLSRDGYAPAALRLADMAEHGEGRAANAAVAMTWRKRAADRGSSEAQYQLAESYMQGRGVEPDEAMAITYYREAARGGHPLATEKLRSIYADAGIPMPDFSRPPKPIAIDSREQVEHDVGATPSNVVVTIAADVDEFGSGGTSGGRSSSALSGPLDAAEMHPEIHAVDADEVLETATQISSPEIAFEATTLEGAPMGHAELNEVSAAESMAPVPPAAPAIIVIHPPAHVALPSDPLVIIEPAKPVNHQVVPGSLLATDSRPEPQPTLTIIEPTIEVSPEPITELDVADLVDSTPIATFEPADVERSSALRTEPQTPDLAATSALQGDVSVDETINALSDEAEALRLAQEHGIEVRLDESTEPSSAAFSAVESPVLKVETASDNEALQRRFEGAERALALENFTHGRNRLKQLSVEGYAPAALRLADMAERGEGIPANAAAAITWRQRAAEMGSAEAQYQLAESYMRSRGVEPDEAMAITYYREAMRSGHPLAKEKLRMIYADAGIPMPDFSRPRKPIAIYAPAAVSNESAAGTKVSAFAEVGVRQPITQLPTPETNVENSAPAEVSQVALSAPSIDVSAEPINEIDVAEFVDATAIAALDEIEASQSSVDTIASDTTDTAAEAENDAPLMSDPVELGITQFAAGAAVGAASAVKPATQTSKGFFSRFKGIFSRDEETAALTGQPLGSEPPAETMADTPTVIADEVGYAVIGTDATDIEVEADARVIEPDPAVNVETDVEVSPALATIEDGKRALADGRFTRAAEIFTRLAQDGDPEAQAHIGYMYYRGEGVELDHSRAIDWYRRAAVQGNRDAQYNLAAAYAFGDGVAQDDSEAVMWYRRAAEQGSAIAQYSLGISYALGEGITRDNVQATRWYRSAAEQGYTAAQYNLGYSYRSGHGVEVDDHEAFQWFTKAAHNGHAAAQYSLGYMYRSGRGVTRDLDEAIKWYRLAADQGHPDAHADLASLNTESF